MATTCLETDLCLLVYSDPGQWFKLQDWLTGNLPDESYERLDVSNQNLFEPPLRLQIDKNFWTNDSTNLRCFELDVYFQTFYVMIMKIRKELKFLVKGKPIVLQKDFIEDKDNLSFF